MERIINKIFRAFRKKYFLITFVFAMIIIVLGGSYSYWSSESGWQLASELTYNNLSYTFTINSVSTTTITSAANSGTVYYNVAITNINEINTKYLLTYNSTASGLSFDVSSLSANDSSGIIGAYEGGAGTGKTKTVRIAVTNNTGNASTITLNVQGGYTWNSKSTITILNGYSAINTYKNEVSLNYGLTLAQEVNALLSCTPTTTSPCLYAGNSNNYVSYGGKVWRILGSYMIGTENVVKLILDGYSTNAVTYSNTAGELSSFYSGLTNTSLVRTSSPFTCTGTSTVTCTGSTSFGMLSKTEYDLIGGANSYLYTSPTKPYWTNTESSTGIYYVGKNKGISTLSGTSSASVKPVIYLKSDVVRNLTTNGTESNPYQIATGLYLTVTANSGTTKFASGYYGSGYTYTDSTPTRTNYVFRDYVVTGTGTSMNSYTLTMGSEASTLTLRWWAIYNVAYNCNGGYGSTSTSIHVEGTSKNLTSSGCYKIVSGASGNLTKISGWDTSSAGTTVVYNDEGSVLSLSSVGGSTVTLYAVWGSSNIFSYSGSYEVLDDTNGNWRIKFTTDGNFVTIKPLLIDVFLVGGGGGGRNALANGYSGGGGAGGLTGTWISVTLNANVAYSVTIGAGGAANGGTGGTTSIAGPGITTMSKTGGAPGSTYRTGGNGGSGGGGDCSYGGSDGSNGGGAGYGGLGQGTTTREFGEAGGDLYAGGGGSGAKGNNATGGAGGNGGGGKGGNTSGGWAISNGANGVANTGGGAGGGAVAGSNPSAGGAGGSGIVVIRKH